MKSKEKAKTKGNSEEHTKLSPNFNLFFEIIKTNNINKTIKTLLNKIYPETIKK